MADAKPKWDHKDQVRMEPFKFTDAQKSELLSTIAEAKVDLPKDVESALIYDVESEIVVFKGIDFYENNKPKIGEQQAALDELLKTSQLLSDKLSSLDSTTKLLLAKHLPYLTNDRSQYWDHMKGRSEQIPKSIDKLINGLHQLIDGLNISKDFLGKTTGASGGPKKKESRILLVQGIATVLRKYSTKKKLVSKTRDGIFERIVSLCLYAATREHIGSVHELCLEALKNH